MLKKILSCFFTKIFFDFRRLRNYTISLVLKILVSMHLIIVAHMFLDTGIVVEFKKNPPGFLRPAVQIADYGSSRKSECNYL